MRRQQIAMVAVAVVAVAVAAHLIERGVWTSTEAVVAIGSSSTDHHGTMTPSSGLGLGLGLGFGLGFGFLASGHRSKSRLHRECPPLGALYQPLALHKA